MRWLRRDTWKVCIAITGLLVLLILMVWVPLSASAYGGASDFAISGPPQAAPTVDVTATMTTLNEEKLRQEIQQVKNQNGNQNNWLAGSSTALIAAAATVIVALFGISQWYINRRDERRKEVITQDKELSDRENERQKEIALQDKELKDRQETQDKELRAQAEERFKIAVTALGDKNEATQIGGAILLRSFLNKEDEKIYERYYTQIFDLAVAYLRSSNASQPSRDNTPMPLTSFRHALIVVLQQSYPLVLDALMDQKKSKFDPRIIDASRICLDGAYLVESDLNRIWMIDASLIGGRLGRAKLHKADLRRSIIRSAFLNGADLSEATFFLAVFDNADLSGANFRKADLRGATFTEATLTNADFTGAKLDEVTVLSKNFRSANPEDARSLEGTNLRGVTGLSEEQKAACKAKGAIIDEEDVVSGNPQSTVALPASIDGSSPASSQQDSESSG